MRDAENAILPAVDGSLGPRPGNGTIHKTMAERVFHQVRADIMSGFLAAGKKVKADDLKARYGVGTSPVREALFQLVSEGLVKADGQRGFRVATLSEEELADITEWRGALECEALRRSILAGDLDWEATAVAALHRLKRASAPNGLSDVERADQWENSHRAFHFALYSACGSPWALRFCELLIAQGERYRRSFLRYDKIDPAITQEHEDLIAAALMRDADRAVTILKAHICRATELAGAFVRGKESSGAM
jgi:GntR family transcriptional regulator, carbon starvation induced regulator